LTTSYQSLNLNCANGTYTVTTGAAQGTGCKWDLVDTYRQLQPLQKRYSFNGRLSFRLSENVEGYATGSYSKSYVSIKGAPAPSVRPSPSAALPPWPRRTRASSCRFGSARRA
jgi:iron complex outermembrane receptor protein